MDKPMTFNEWMGTLGFDALVHANCCRKAYEAGQQSQQAKVEELQNLYTQQGINMLKLQKNNAWLSDVAERENKRANKLQKDNTGTLIHLGKVEQQKAELQKRVNVLSKRLSEATGLIVEDLEQALKGEG